MPVKTKPEPPTSSAHDDALRSLAYLIARHTAAMDQAQAEVDDAQRAHDEWNRPAERLKHAKSVLTQISVTGSADIDKLRNTIVSTADPALALEIRRLEQEIMVIGTLFQSWGRATREESNYDECEAYRLGVMNSIQELRAFQHQSHDAESAKEKIMDLRRTSAPRPIVGKL